MRTELFKMKKLISAILIPLLILNASGCGHREEDGYVESGELVVIRDDSDINLAIYDIDTLNPIATKSESVQKIMNIVYDPLFTTDEKENSVPCLAESYNISEDGRQMTVNLRQDIKWHDGTNFTADDVVYTLSKMVGSDGLYKSVAKKIKSFTAVNKNRVIINFEKPETDFSNCLTFPIISKNTKYVSDDSFVPMGTGAYKFESRSSSEIVLTPSEPGGNINKRVIVKILKDAAAAAEAFNVNELDAITSDELDLESSAPKNYSRVKTITSDNLVFMGFNTENEVLSSSGIRRALNAIADKKKIVETCAYGNGVETDMPIKPNSWAYSAADNKISQAETEALFEQEGYSLNGGVYYKDGKPLALTILVNEENEKRRAVAESLSADMRGYGISATVRSVDYNSYISSIESGNYEIFIGETVVDANQNPAVMLGGESNYFRYDTSALDKAKNSLYGITDKEVYKQAVKEYFQIFNASPPYVPLYFKTESVIYGSYVSGTDEPVCYDTFKNIEKWYFYDKNGKEKKELSDE